MRNLFVLLALFVVVTTGSGCLKVRTWLVHMFTPTYAPVSADAGPARLTLKEVVGGLTQPTDIQFVPGQPNLMIVLEKTGRARVVDLSAAESKVLSDLFETKVRHDSELGLLGIAFHPAFATNGLFYVNTNPSDGPMGTVISEWKVTPTDIGKSAATQTRILMEFDQPYPNHDGGQLQFGPDGMLYIGTGDGGWKDDPDGNGQKMDTLLGKMLRIDVDHPEPPLAYGIPKDNPFLGRKDVRAEIWAYGLRNPWRYCFDPKGRLIAADVGQDTWEEIDIISKGDNLGWNIREAAHCFQSDKCKTEGLVEPIHEYGREEGSSITGGYVYTGESIPWLKGQYVFGDFNSARIWAIPLPDKIEKVPATFLTKAVMLISTFGRDASGELYVGDWAGGTVSKLVPAPQN